MARVAPKLAISLKYSTYATPVHSADRPAWRPRRRVQGLMRARPRPRAVPATTRPTTGCLRQWPAVARPSGMLDVVGRKPVQHAAARQARWPVPASAAPAPDFHADAMPHQHRDAARADQQSRRCAPPLARLVQPDAATRAPNNGAVALRMAETPASIDSAACANMQEGQRRVAQTDQCDRAPVAAQRRAAAAQRQQGQSAAAPHRRRAARPVARRRNPAPRCA